MTLTKDQVVFLHFGSKHSVVFPRLWKQNGHFWKYFAIPCHKWVQCGLDIKTPQVTLLYKDLGITPKSSYDLTDFQLPSKNISAKGTQHELESPFLYGADKYIVEEFQTVVDNMIQNHPSSFPKKISWPIPMTILVNPRNFWREFWNWYGGGIGRD